MATVNLGRVGFVPKGEYSASTQYEKYDIVTYNGSTYTAWATMTGVTPGSDNTKWKLLMDGSGGEEVLIQATEPESENNKIWIPGASGDEVEVPTMGEFNDVKSSVEEIEASKQDVLTFDNAPTVDSDNPVKSGGVAIAERVSANSIDGAMSELSGKTVYTPDTFGHYYTAATNQTYANMAERLTPSAGYSCMLIEVVPGEVYHIHTHGYMGTNRGWFICDAEGARTRFSGKTSGVEDTILIIEQGEKYLAINNRTANGTECWAIKVETNYDQQPWKGLYVSLLGDSISSFGGYIPSVNKKYYPNWDVLSVTDMWWYQLITALGGTPLIMDAWSGSCVTKGVRAPIDGNSYLEMSDVSRCQRLHACVKTTQDDADAVEVTAENIDGMRISPFVPYDSEATAVSVGDYVKIITPDIVIVAGGTNDYSYIKTASGIGTYDAHSALPNPNGVDAAVTTFREAYATMLCRIQEKYTSALPVCCSPLYMKRPNVYNWSGNKNSDSGLTVQDFDDAIQNIARIRACPYVDIFANGFNRYNYYPTFAEDYETTTTHPNKLGQRIIARNAIPKFRDVCAGFVEWMRENRA